MSALSSRRQVRPKPARRTATLCVQELESRDLLSVDLRIAVYNIASVGGAPRAGLDTILHAIGQETVNGTSRQIDILALQEVQSQSTTTRQLATKAFLR